MKKSYLFTTTTTTTTTTILTLAILVMTAARPYRIYGDCMEPAFQDGKLCFLNKIYPYIKKYKIGDVILFKHESKVWISRVVALENDTILIKKESILVNNFPLKKGATKRSWRGWNYGKYAISKPFKVPRNHVFVLSDNLSAKHDDSRVFGPINKESILGLVWLKVFFKSDIGKHALVHSNVPFQYKQAFDRFLKNAKLIE